MSLDGAELFLGLGCVWVVHVGGVCVCFLMFTLEIKTTASEKNISHSHFDLHFHLKLETKDFYSISGFAAYHLGRAAALLAF